MLACNAFPGVLCGHIVDPSDAYMFAQINDGNAIALPFAKGFGWGAVCGAWMSPCRLAIAPMQDLLGLGGDARVNTPGTAGPRNWSWRVRQEALNPSVSGRLAHITRTYRR